MEKFAANADAVTQIMAKVRRVVIAGKAFSRIVAACMTNSGKAGKVPNENLIWVAEQIRVQKGRHGAEVTSAAHEDYRMRLALSYMPHLKLHAGTKAANDYLMLCDLLTDDEFFMNVQASTFDKVWSPGDECLFN